MNLTLTEYIQKVQNWELKPQEVVYHYLQKSKDSNQKYNAYIHFLDWYIEQNLEQFASKPLKAAPIAVKDNILIKGYRATCASKYLEDFVSPYTATHIQYLEQSGGLAIWKTNMDEYAMGGSGEHSYFWPARNPYDLDRVPWGSSSWSAVAVAADLALGAIGSDTWWSIRQPAALTGVVGVKPTYGRVSRFGVQAMASSLDQVGTFGKTVQDAMLLLQAISGYDSKDSTSAQLDNPADWNQVAANFDIKQAKIAIPKQFLGQWLDEQVKASFLQVVEQLKAQGAQITQVDFPELDLALAVYYILMPAEVSTNLARLDGIKYWLQKDTFEFDSIYQYYEDIRAEWFGDEVKRRILMWTYVLSEWYYDAYYARALKLRNKIKKRFDAIFGDFDFIISPTSPIVAWKLGEKTQDPIQMYLADVYTVPVNLAWLPAISVPAYPVQVDDVNLPVGFHIIADIGQEAKMFALSQAVQNLVNLPLSK